MDRELCWLRDKKKRGGQIFIKTEREKKRKDSQRETDIKKDKDSNTEKEADRDRGRVGVLYRESIRDSYRETRVKISQIET